VINNTLADGISYSFIETNRFKTTLISVGFYLPSNENNAVNSLALSIMKSGTNELPDLYSFNRKLASLYGATVNAWTAKNGDCLEMRVCLAVNSDRFALNEEKVSDLAGKLLCDMIFDRYNAKDICSDEIFAREKRLLQEKISSELNDKRTYAKSKCEELMCKEEPYGYPVNGTLKQAESLSKEDVALAFKTILEKAFVSIIIIGDSEPEAFISNFKSRISSVNRSFEALPQNTFREAHENCRELCEKMPIAQGKLVLGLRTATAIGNDRETVPVWVMSYIYGMGTTSKLFMNVREKLSLCYYCSARPIRDKGLIFVESGVEEKNMESAQEAILNEYNSLKIGDFSDWDLDCAKRSIIDRIRSIESDQSSLLNWYSSKALDEQRMTTEDACVLVSKVTREQVIEAANAFSLDSIYRLLPDENVKEENV
jgi:predicted Zn-dependent peptidase